MPDRDIPLTKSEIESNIEFDPDSKMSTLALQYQQPPVSASNSLPPLSQLMTMKQEAVQIPLYQPAGDSPRSSYQNLGATTTYIQPDLSPNMNPYNQVPIVAYPYPQQQQLLQVQVQPKLQHQQQVPVLTQGIPPPPPHLDSTHLFEKCTCRSENNHIPRPRNAFILFRQKNHQALLDEGNVIRTNPDVSRELGRRWRNLSPKEKDYWNKCAEDEKKRHAEKYPGYKYSPRRNSKKNCPSCKAKLALRNHNLNIQSYLAQYPNSSLYPNQSAVVLSQLPQQQQQLQQLQQLQLQQQQLQQQQLQQQQLQQQQLQQQQLQQQHLQHYQQPVMYSNHYIPQQQLMFSDIPAHQYYVDQTTGYINTNGNMTQQQQQSTQSSQQQQQYIQNPPLHSISPISNVSSNSTSVNVANSTTPTLVKPEYRSYHSSAAPFKTENIITMGTTTHLVNTNQARGNISPQMAHPHLPSINNLSLPPPFTREK